MRQAHAAAEAATATAKLTPLKGGTFEQGVHDLMDGIAAASLGLVRSPEQLGGIDEVKRLSGLIGRNAATIDKEADGLRSGLDRLLGQAMSALAGAAGAGAAA